MNQVIASRIVKLQPHLEPPANPLQPLHKPQRLPPRREVKSNNQPILRGHRSLSSNQDFLGRLHRVSLTRFSYCPAIGINGIRSCATSASAIFGSPPRTGSSLTLPTPLSP